MKLKNISIGLILIILLASLAYAVEFTPQGNINLKNRYNITNVDWIFGSISAENVKDPAVPCNDGYYMKGFNDNLSDVTCVDSGMVGGTWTASQNASGKELYDLSLWNILNGNTKVKANSTGFWVDGGDGYEKVTYSDDITVCRGKNTVDDIIKTFTCDYVSKSTDTPTTTRTTINNAMVACEGNGGGEVLMKGGDYVIDTILVIKDNCTLKGVGDATAISWSTHGGSHNIDYTGSNRVGIENLYIDATNATGTVLSLVSEANEMVTVRDLHIFNVSSRAITINSTRVEVSGCWLEDVNSGIALYDAAGADISDCHIFDNVIENLNWNSSSLTEYGEGIELNHGTMENVSAIIEMNTITGFREEGIDVNTPNAVVNNNIIEMAPDETRASSGITIGSTVRSRVTCNGNVIRNVPSNGHAIYIWSVQSATLNSNTIECYSTSASSTGILLKSNTTRSDMGGASVSMNNIGNCYIGINASAVTHSNSLIGNVYFKNEYDIVDEAENYRTNFILDSKNYNIYDVPSHGALLHFSFNNDSVSGDENYDSSIKQNHAMNHGATYNSTGGFDGSGCYEFWDDYILTESNLDITKTSEATMMAWVRYNHTPNTRNSYIADNANKDGFSFYSRGSSGDGLRFIVRNNAASWEYATITSLTSKITVGDWVHIAGTVKDNDKICIYLNGDLDNCVDYTGTIAYAAGVSRYVIGSKGDYTTSFRGSIDEFIVLNKRLTPEQIKSVYLRKQDFGEATLKHRDIKVNTTAIYPQNNVAMDFVAGYNITDIAGNAIIGGNATCTFIYSPDGSTKTEICNS